MPPSSPSTEPNSIDVTGVILAAGASSRMGQPKQLLQYGGMTLLQRVIQGVLGAGLARVVVVLGSEAARIRPTLEGLPVQVVVNTEWREGLAGSIRCAVRWVVANAAASAGLLLVAADQVLLPAAGLNRIRREFERDPERIVVARYGSTRGIPALFGRSLFDELLELEGDRGAQPVLARHSARIVEVAMPEAAVDIDSPEDWERLLSSDKMPS